MWSPEYGRGGNAVLFASGELEKQMAGFDPREAQDPYVMEISLIYLVISIIEPAT